jgi:hypothetical protein
VAKATPYDVQAAVDSSQILGTGTPGLEECTVGTEDHALVEAVQLVSHLDGIVGEVTEVAGVAYAAGIVKGVDVDMGPSHKEDHIQAGEAQNTCHR